LGLSVDLSDNRPLAAASAAAKQKLCSDVMVTQSGHHHHHHQHQQLHVEHPRRACMLPSIDTFLFNQSAWSSSPLSGWHSPDYPDLFRPWVVISAQRFMM